MDEKEKLVLESIKKYRSLGYDNDKIKQIMKNSGIADEVASKLLNYKPFYLRVWFFVPVILALIFAGFFYAFLWDDFVTGPVDEIELGDEVVGDEVVGDEVVEEGDACVTDEDCGKYYLCSSKNKCIKKGDYALTLTDDEIETDTSSGADSLEDGSSSSGGGSSGGGSSGGGSGSGSGEGSSSTVECSDGIDNDGDGNIDYIGNDLGCVDVNDNSEADEVSTAEVMECNDKIDNGNDGSLDFTGGCDVDADGEIDYICGCYDLVSESFSVYTLYFDDVCDSFGGVYACRGLDTTNFVSTEETGEIDVCEEGLSGVYYDPDEDCESSSVDNEDPCESDENCGVYACVDTVCQTSCDENSDCSSSAACVTDGITFYGTCVECVDNDGGNYSLVYGEITGVSESSLGFAGTRDYCISATLLQERYCKDVDGNLYLSYETFDCETLGEDYICSEGVCVAPNVEVECNDFLDNDGDDTFDATGGCEIADSGQLNYVCGCFDPLTTFVEYGSEDLDCVSLGNDIVYGCAPVVGLSVSEQFDPTFICNPGESADRIYHPADTDCVEEVVEEEREEGEGVVSCETLDCGVYACNTETNECYNYCDAMDDEDITTNVGCAGGYYCSEYGVCEVAPVAGEICNNLMDDDEDGYVDVTGGCFYLSANDPDPEFLDLICGCYDEGFVEYGDETLDCGSIGGVYGCLELDTNIFFEDVCEPAYLDGEYYWPDSECIVEEEIMECNDGFDNDEDGGYDLYGICVVGEAVRNCYDLILSGVVALDDTTGATTCEAYCGDLVGVFSDKDFDCESVEDVESAVGPSYVAGIEESFFVKLWNWLIFWD